MGHRRERCVCDDSRRLRQDSEGHAAPRGDEGEEGGDRGEAEGGWCGGREAESPASQDSDLCEHMYGAHTHTHTQSIVS